MSLNQIGDHAIYVQIKAYFQKFFGFIRNVYLVLIASMLLGLALEGGIYAVLFTSLFTAPRLWPEIVGQINSSGLLAFAFCSLPAGVLGNRYGSRQAMLWA